MLIQLALTITTNSLSGRRAMAIYALLISNTDPGTAVKMWQYIPQREMGLKSTRYDACLDRFICRRSGQRVDEGLYAETLPTRTQTEQNMISWHGEPTPAVKADFQGCGEFNPVLLFSQENQARFDQPQKVTGASRKIKQRSQSGTPKTRQIAA